MKIYVVYEIDRDSNILNFDKAFKTYNKAYEYSLNGMKKMPLDRALYVKELVVE